MAGERTAAAKAATLFNVLIRIDEEEAEELAASPDAIREKHDARRNREREKAEKDVLLLADAMYRAACSAAESVTKS